MDDIHSGRERLEAFDISIYRRMLRIGWMYRVTSMQMLKIWGEDMFVLRLYKREDTV